MHVEAGSGSQPGRGFLQLRHHPQSDVFAEMWFRVDVTDTKCVRSSRIILSDGPGGVLPRDSLPVLRDRARIGRNKKSDDVERQVFPPVDNQAFLPVPNANAGY
jgi:hypothetical protein